MGAVLEHCSLCKSAAKFGKHRESGYSADIVFELAVTCQQLLKWEHLSNLLRCSKIWQEFESRKLPQCVQVFDEGRDPVHFCRA